MKNIRYSYIQILDAFPNDLIDDLKITDFNLVPAEVQNSKIDDLVRKSKIAWLSDTKKHECVYKKVTDIGLDINKKYFNYDIFDIEFLQYTVYTDDSNFYGIHTDYGQSQSCRKLSITIQLSDSNDYEGGELVLYNSAEKYVAKKDKGSVIVFPSWLPHEVTPVTKGVRKSLVGWFIGPEWK